jgi:regulator of replication initiation timing
LKQLEQEVLKLNNGLKSEKAKNVKLQDENSNLKSENKKMKKALAEYEKQAANQAPHSTLAFDPSQQSVEQKRPKSASPLPASTNSKARKQSEPQVVNMNSHYMAPYNHPPSYSMQPAAEQHQFSRSSS